MNTKIELQGVEEVLAALQKTSNDLAERHLAAAVREGANVFRDEIKQQAPVDTGTLRDDIKTRKDRRPDDAPVAYDVGPGKKGFYARFIEFGHAKVAPGQRRTYRTTVKAGKDWAGGRVPPRPFMRPAFDSKQAEAEKAVADELKKRLNLS